MKFEEKEIKIFDDMSSKKINELKKNYVYNIDRYEKHIKLPYVFFEKKIIENSKNCDLLVDLCCGDGIHSFVASNYVNEIIGIDFSKKSIDLCNKVKSQKKINNVTFKCDSILNYNFNKKADIVIIAGSFSYFNHMELIKKIYDTLNQDGKLIIIDSLNDNYFYRINRYKNWLMGRRTLYTVQNMPMYKKLIELLELKFEIVETKNFGIFMFLSPLLKLFFKAEFISNLMTYFDKYFSKFSRFSFKTVIVAKKR